jgi:hypothetical protein
MYVNESPVKQSPDESIAYSITTTPWGSTPASLAMYVYDVTPPGGATDVTSTVTTSSITAAGDVITTKRIRLLTAGHDYRCDVQFTDANSNIWEASFKILCRNA